MAARRITAERIPEVGEAITERCRRLDLTLPEVSKKANISRSSAFRAMKGHPLSPDVARKLSVALGWEPHAIEQLVNPTPQDEDLRGRLKEAELMVEALNQRVERHYAKVAELERIVKLLTEQVGAQPKPVTDRPARRPVVRRAG